VLSIQNLEMSLSSKAFDESDAIHSGCLAPAGAGTLASGTGLEWLRAFRHQRAANDGADHFAPANRLAASLFGNAGDLAINGLEKIEREADLDDRPLIGLPTLRGSRSGSLGLFGSHGPRA
jgi:hypothetical protein